MVKASPFIEHLGEVFRLFGSVSFRPMFGGHGMFHQGVMVGLVADDTLYLKTDAQTAPMFARAGSLPFEYSKKGVPMKISYASAPAEVFDDPDLAKAWASLALEAALRSRTKAAARVERGVGSR